ncbi:MAG: hypothetical protein KA383_20345 [Phycisphaerae bacterium]|nr:hypothetical protein [Phycisphaerae bacterium]
MNLDAEQEVARVLARGLLRWRRRMHAAGFDAAQNPVEILANRLELSGETRLSVSDGTRGLSARGDGEDA